MIFPYKDINPTERFPFITIVLIIINCIAFLVQFYSDPGYHEIVRQFAFIPYELHHGNLPGSALVHPYITLVTYMFLHGNFFHIVFNMLFLWIFGNNIEDRMSRIGFIIFYLAAGVIAALAFELVHPGAEVPLIGASGAVSAIIGAYLFLYPGAKLRVLVVIFPVTVPAFIFIIIWFVTQISSFFKASGNVAWISHIAGFITGIILHRFFLRNRT